MKAVFLLWFLRATSGYPPAEKIASVWSVLTHIEEPQPPLPQECVTSEQMCSCCLMETQLERMERVYNTSIHDLDLTMQSARMRIDKMINSRSAFSVSLNNDEVLSCLGLFDQDETILYKHIFINQDVYDIDTGKFRAGRSGVYNFAITIHKMSSSHNTACVAVQVNGEDVETVTEINENDGSDTAMTALVVELNEGDVVEVRLKAGCAICDDKKHLNTFTGFLLYVSMEG